MDLICINESSPIIEIDINNSVNHVESINLVESINHVNHVESVNLVESINLVNLVESTESTESADMSEYSGILNSSNAILVTDDCDLPKISGLVEINSSVNPITITMKNANISGHILALVKISTDNNSITLYSETSLVNGGDITIFGVLNDVTELATAHTLILQSLDSGWKILQQK